MTGRDEDGFTLVELLVVITIVGILATALAQALMIGLHTTTAAATAFTDAVDARALTSHLLSDIGSAEVVCTTATAGPPCDTPPGDATRVLWTKDADGDVATYSMIRIPADPATGTPDHSQLVRQAGAGGQVVTLADWPGIVAAPQILCDDRPECAAQQPLPAPGLTASQTQFDLAHLTGFPDPAPDDATPDTRRPYQISVGDEAMTVLDIKDSTLTVTRPSGVTHAAGDAVTYTPDSVSVRIPRSDGADPCDADPCTTDDDFNLTVTRGAT
jgi:prepilin-type N-terminal cleavage/methylation domain-containing protein